MSKSINFFSVILVLNICFSYGLSAQQNRDNFLKIGDKPPELKLTKVVNGETNLPFTLATLKGQVVILEFWATWCAPCIPALDHMNEVVSKFRDRPVKFVAISSEDENKVTAFLRKRKFHGAVGLDETGETRAAYQFSLYPHTVIIGKDGKIAAITLAKNVTEETITALLEGKQISLPVKKDVQADRNWDKELLTNDTIFHAIIRLSSATSGGAFIGKNRYMADGVGLISLLNYAFDATAKRSVYNIDKFELTKQRYRASVVVPQGKEEMLKPTFRRLLADTFDVTHRKEKREVDVFVLRPASGGVKLRNSSAAKKHVKFGNNIIDGKKQPIGALTKVLVNFLSLPVVDETGLTGEYDWKLEYNEADRSILANSVKTNLGLELVKTKRNIEFSIFDKKP